MKRLELNIKKRGFLYTQVLRGKRSCIYERTVSEKSKVYEVFIIKIKPQSKIGDIIIESKEWFPSDSAFGKWAWNYYTYEEAFNKFEALESK